MEKTKVNYPQVDLYHYTSLNTLISIIQNRTIRLTDYRFLNDVQEANFTLNRIEEAAKRNNNDNSKYVISIINNIRNGKIVLNKSTKINGVNYICPTTTRVNYYTFSLSNERDDLLLWEMYAKNGCCIKFNSQKTLEFFHSFRDSHIDNGIWNIPNGKVMYGNGQKIDTLIEMLALDYHKITNELNIYDTIMQVALTSKCESFKSEKEFRIALPFNKELVSNSEKFEFIISDGIIKPQIELKDFPVEELIDEIIISPFLSGNIVKSGIEELLYVNGLINTKISISEIQIR